MSILNLGISFPLLSLFLWLFASWDNELVATATSRIRKAIEGLETTIATISEEASMYHVDSLRSRNLTRPAVSLPPEILSSIFTFACYQNLSVYNELSGGFEASESSDVLLRDVRNLVMSTCYLWREVALRTRVLWATVFVSACWMETHQRPDFDDLPDIISVEIERAHPHPISLLCELDHDESWATLYPTLLPVLPACRLISIDISWVAGTWTTELSQLSLPLLRALILSFSGDDAVDNMDAILLPMPDTPNLEDLEIGYPCILAPVRDIRMAVPRLPHLKRLSLFGKFSTSNVFDVLRGAPNITHFSWRADKPFTSTAHVATMVSLHSLRHLQIEGRMAFAGVQRIEAPALERLSIEFARKEDNLSVAGSLEDVAECVRNVSFTQITSMAVIMPNKQSQSDLILPYIARFPALKSFFVQSDITTEMGTFLGRVPATHPHLRDVWIESYDTPRDVVTSIFTPLLAARAAFFQVGVDPSLHLNLNLLLPKLFATEIPKLSTAGGASTDVRAATCAEVYGIDFLGGCRLWNLKSSE